MIAPQPALVLEVDRPSALGELPHSLQHARAAGFGAVAIKQNSSHQALDAQASIPTLRDTVHAASLAVPLIRAHLQGLSPDDVRRPGAALEPFLELAAALSSKDIVATFGPDLLNPQEAIQRLRVTQLISVIRPITDAAARRGMRLLWSPPFDMVAPPQLVDEVLRGIDRPNFGIELDVARADAAARLGGHSINDEGKPLPGALGILERFKGWIGAVRVVDTQTWNDDWPPLKTDDQTDWPRLLPALIDAWIPAPYWTLATTPDHAASAYRGFQRRLAPYTTDAA